MQKTDKIIRTLHQISTEHHLGFEHQIHKMLKLGCIVFGMDIGILSQIENQRYTILHVFCPSEADLTPGASYELGETYCSELLKLNHPMGIEHAKKSNTHAHPAYKTFALEAYIGTTVIVKGRTFGTLNFSSHTPSKRPFTELDYDVIQLMAVWIGSEFDRLEDAQRLQTAFDNLKAAEERFRLGIEASPSGMIMIDDHGKIVHINRLAENMFGYEHNELLNQMIEVLVPDSARHKHAAQRADYKKAPSFRPMESRKNLTALRKNGEQFPVEIGLNPIDTPDGNLVLCVIQDITERKLYEETILEQAEELKRVNSRLAELASTDALTKVANRRSMITHLEKMLAQASRSQLPLSFVLADIDHFKKHNDSFGHLAGDEALKVTADLLVNVARRSDIVARYGGEEFALLLPDTDTTGAIQIAERCRHAIEQQNFINNPITASFGISTIIINSLPDNSIHQITDRIISEADSALYYSKDAGRNQVTHFARCKD